MDTAVTAAGWVDLVLGLIQRVWRNDLHFMEERNLCDSLWQWPLTSGLLLTLLTTVVYSFWTCPSVRIKASPVVAPTLLVWSLTVFFRRSLLLSGELCPPTCIGRIRVGLLCHCHAFLRDVCFWVCQHVGRHHGGAGQRRGAGTCWERT